MAKPATKQATSPISGVAPPKERQFGQPNGNPRHNGAWKKEDSARFKLEQMIKLDSEEILKIANDPKAPLFERRIAKSLLKEDGWKITESMINQVYGMPKQQVEQTNIELKPILPKRTNGVRDNKRAGKDKSAE